MHTVAGVDLYISHNNAVNATEIDPVLLKYIDDIKDFAYETSEVVKYQKSGASIKVRDMANMNSKSMYTLAFSPSSLIDHAFDLTSYDWESPVSALGSVE